MAGTLGSVFAALKYLDHRSDDDFIDRLHYFTTSNLLLALAVLISFKQFGGKPIECMVPDFFPGAWEQYAENYCWAQDTYFLSFDKDVTRQTPREYKISYYQWVPFFLLLVACCFRLPSLIWKYLAAHSGIRIHDLVKLAVDERNVQSDVKQANIKALTTHLQNALRFHRRLVRKRITPHRVLRLLNLPYTAVYVTFTYLLTKILYLVNIWVQLLMMNKFLHTDKQSWYGLDALHGLLNGTEWTRSGVFPRVTLCDFEVRGMGNLQNYTVQCVLVINIFNEKIFIFLWFWFLVLMVLTTGSFVYWFFVTVFPWPGVWFVSRHLELSEMPFDPKGSHKDVERFVASYLKTDGVFVLRMITMHSGIIFGTDLVLSLWRSFYGIEEKVRNSQFPPMTPTPPASTKDENLKNTLRQRFQRKDSGKRGKSDYDQQLTEPLFKAGPPMLLLPPPSAPKTDDLDMPDTAVKPKRTAPQPPQKPGKELLIRIPQLHHEDEQEPEHVLRPVDVEPGVRLLPKKEVTEKRTSV